MTVYTFKNNAESTLASNIGTGDVSISVAAGEGALFPNPGSGEQFDIIVIEGSTTEWMVCTSRSTDTLTVTRAASPSAFNSGALVEHRITDDAMNNFIQKAAHREVSSSPDGSLVANYTGEEVLDTTNSIWYKHIQGTVWKALNS